jgi:peptide/nickel transport system substrate-binding protein
VQSVAATEAGPGWLQGKYTAFVSPISAELEASKTILNYTSRYNLDPNPPQELKDLAAAASAAPLDSPEREAAYKKVSQYLVANPVQIPLVWGTQTWLARPNVVGAENVSVRKQSEVEFRGVGIAAS